MLRNFRKGKLTKVLEPCIMKWKESRPIERAAVAVLLAGALFCCWQTGEEEAVPVSGEEVVATDGHATGETGRAAPSAADRPGVTAIRGSEAAAQRVSLRDPFQPDHPGPEKVQEQGRGKGKGNKHGAEAAGTAKNAVPGENRSEQGQAVKGKTAQPELQGIIQSEDRLGALLLISGNSYLLAQGESQGNVQVLSINSAGVEIQQGGQIKWLQLL